jgi:hypothetical protein
MRHIHNGFLIVSATNSHQDADNNNKLIQAILNEQGIPFRIVGGCYKGKTEISYVVNSHHEPVVAKLADLFSQESYLKVHGDNCAELIFSRDKTENLGYFQEYKGNHPEELTAYTLDPETGVRWIVGPLCGLSAELTSLNKRPA